MATVSCTLNGSAYYNGGWKPGSGYDAVGATTSYGGDGRFYVMKFTVPHTVGAFTSASFTVSLDLVKSYHTSSKLNWGISYIGREGSRPPSMIWSGTWDISGLTVKHQKFTATTGAMNLTSGTALSGTFYLWLWGGNLVQMYKYSPASTYYSVSLNYTAVTSVGAPSSVSATGRVGRGLTTYISWSGASAGVSNSITGYRIYYAAGSTPTTSSSYWTVSTSSTSGNYTTPALSTTQGTVYYFKVMTLGSAGGSYYSGLSSSTPSTTINYTPTVSAFSVNTPIVSSRGSKGVTFNITRADANGDTVYARFYRVNGSTYTQLGEITGTSGTYTLSTSILPENASTTGVDASYTFAVRVTDAYDSWRYYAERTLIITRKAKPVISSITVTAANTPSYRTLTDNNTLPFCTLVDATMAKYGTVASVGWRIRVSNSTSFSGNGVSISESTALSSFNVASYVGFGQYYQIGLQVNSGYEYSDIVWKTSGYTSGSRTAVGFYMAPAIQIIGVSNKNTNITAFNPTLNTYANTVATDFSSEIAISHTYNSLYTVTYWWNKTNSTSDMTQIGSGSIGNYGTNLNLPSSISAFNVTARTTFYLFLRTTYSNLATNTGPNTMTKIITNPLRNTILTNSIAGSVKPIYTNATSSYAPTFTQFWGTNNLATYYDMPTDWTNFSLHLSVASQTKIIHQGGPGNIPGVLSNDTRRWPFTGTQLYDWATNVLGLTFNTDYTASLQLQVTDYFNNTYTVSSSGFTLSLKEAPLFTTTEGTQITYNRGEGEVVIEPNTDVIINEGYRFKFTIPTARTYANTNLTYNLYICRSPIRLTDLTTGEYTLYAPLPATRLQNSTLTFNHTVTSIANPMYCYFKVVVNDPLGQNATAYYNNYTVLSGKLQNISPTNLSISNGGIDATQTVLSFNYILDDAGGGLVNGATTYDNFDNGNGLIKLDIQYSFDGQDFDTYDTPIFEAHTFSQMSAAIQNGIRAANFMLPKVSASFVYMRLLVTVQAYITGIESAVAVPIYTTYSNTIAIPNIQPTVAYRKGHLGINRQEFEDDEVLVINVGPGAGENGRHIIKLMSADWEGRINIVTGEIDGFTIREGSWD